MELVAAISQRVSEADRPYGPSTPPTLMTTTLKKCTVYPSVEAMVVRSIRGWENKRNS